MEEAILIARLFLAAVLIIAGLAKLASRSRTSQSLAEFGIGKSLIPALTWLLPIAELVTGVALVWTRTADYGAVAALTLFLTFTAGIAYNLALGRRPKCNCFGQVDSKPVGRNTIVRNTLLSLIAAAVVLAPASSQVSGVSSGWRLLLVASLIAGFALATIIMLTLEMINRQDDLARQIEDLEEFISSDSFQSAGSRDRVLKNQDLPVGAPAPQFNLASIDDRRRNLKELLDPGKSLVIFFLSSDCGPCSALIPEIDLWRLELSHRFAFAVISKGSVESNRLKFAKSALDSAVPILVDEDGSVTNAYHAQWTPAAIVVTAAGTINSQLAFGNQQITALVDHLIESQTLTPWFSAPGGSGNAGNAVAKIGDPAPLVVVPDARGREVDLSTGRKTLVVFWGPNCGYCKEILEELQEWERDRAADAPQLLVVSRGDAASYGEMNLQSPVVLDHDLQVSRAFGTPGTPSAILIDGEGKVASVLGSGADEVFALAGHRRAPK